MKFAAVLGWLNTRVLLTLVYIIVIGFIAVLVKIFRKDLLRKRSRNPITYWLPKEKVVHSLENAKHQF